MIQKLLFRTVLIFLLLLTGLLFPAQEYTRKNIKTTVNDTISLNLAEADGRLWEIRVIDPSLISLLQKERKKGLLFVKLGMKKEGLGRIEAVELQGNVVSKRVYYFFQITAAASNNSSVLTNTTAGDASSTPAKDGGIAKKQFDLAMRVFHEGSYDEAARILKIFRESNKQSSFDMQAALYRGIALHRTGQNDAALKLFLTVSQKGTERIQQQGLLWSGHMYRIKKDRDKTLHAYLKVISAVQYPDVAVQARLGLARYYAAAGNYRLADMQFDKIMANPIDAADSKPEQQLAGLFSLYYAAEFYDRDVNRVWKAYRFYLAFLNGAKKIIIGGKLPASSRRELQKMLDKAGSRSDYLRRQFIDYH